MEINNKAKIIKSFLINTPPNFELCEVKKATRDLSLVANHICNVAL